MENFIEKGIAFLAIVGSAYFFIFRPWKQKRMLFQALAIGLGGKSFGSGVVGQFGDFEYTIYIDKGAAMTSNRFALPSSIRIVVEKTGAPAFRYLRGSNNKQSSSLKNAGILEEAAVRLFFAGFTHIEYDGQLLDIKLSPAMLDQHARIDFIKKQLPIVSQIVNALS